jgi:transposase-like protein
MKEVLSIEVGENESAKFWLSVLNNLKNRGVRDILTICADGLSGISEAIQVAFPQTEYQRCIVHMVRNTLKHVSEKYKKAFANDLKKIYHAPDEETGHQIMLDIKEKWDKIYPNAMKRWLDDWSAVCPVFKYSAEVRKALYTTNAIESLNSQYRKLNNSRSVFPSDDALKKALYLSTMQITKKWTTKIRNWGMIYGELSIHFDGRLL